MALPEALGARVRCYKLFCTNIPSIETNSINELIKYDASNYYYINIDNEQKNADGTELTTGRPHARQENSVRGRHTFCIYSVSVYANIPSIDTDLHMTTISYQGRARAVVTGQSFLSKRNHRLVGALSKHLSTLLFKYRIILHCTR